MRYNVYYANNAYGERFTIETEKNLKKGDFVYVPERKGLFRVKDIEDENVSLADTLYNSDILVGVDTMLKMEREESKKRQQEIDDCTHEWRVANTRERSEDRGYHLKLYHDMYCIHCRKLTTESKYL